MILPSDVHNPINLINQTLKPERARREAELQNKENMETWFFRVFIFQDKESVMEPSLQLPWLQREEPGRPGKQI